MRPCSELSPLCGVASLGGAPRGPLLPQSERPCHKHGVTARRLSTQHPSHLLPSDVPSSAEAHLPRALPIHVLCKEGQRAYNVPHAHPAWLRRAPSVRQHDPPPHAARPAGAKIPHAHSRHDFDGGEDE